MKFYHVLPLCLSLPVISIQANAQEEVLQSAPVIVSASRYEYHDTEATYASEVYSAEDIAQSGANTIYEFLSNNTSVTVMPSFGNPFSQKLDMRGFGIGDGYQNIVVSVDGRRLNNIDMVPQLLSAITLSSIERIEITKGSGSVIYGDGATAGSIQIYTRDRAANTASITAGNFGLISSAASVGLTEERLSLSVSANSYHHDGFSDADVTGKKDNADADNLHARLSVSATDTLEFRLNGARSRIDTRYPGSLTQTEFVDNPAQNSGNTYTHQQYEVDNTGFGLTADLNDSLSLSADHYDEDKHSDYNSRSWVSDYDYQSDDLSLNYNRNALNIIVGTQAFDGARIASTNTTRKENLGYYLQTHLAVGDTRYSLGGRREEVDYTYTPTSGTELSGSHKLSGYDLGVNHRYNTQLSVFANYNNAFQAPDIDRFFNYGGTFNGFIAPARSRTINLGLNHNQVNNRLKLTMFYIDMENEIFYYSAAFMNTNIDKSHKYGLEIQNNHAFNKQLSASLNYAYTRAIIDNEDSGGGAYDGKDLPGVSKHTATVVLNYEPTSRSSCFVSHAYRSEAYAANDFENNFSQRQQAYNSTDIGYRYHLDKIELSVRISNLFEHANGLWIRDDAIYPVNFTRNVQLGIKVEL